MAYSSVIAEAVRQKLQYSQSSIFSNLPYMEIIDPANKYRHSGAFGATGVGKTTNRIATVECRLRQGFKVICFDQQDELEFLGLPCPEGHPIYPKLQKRKPHALRIHVLVPLAYEGGQRVVQWSEIPLNWDFFLLSLYDLDVVTKDWNTLLGHLSGVREQILKTSLLQKEPEWGLSDLYADVQLRFLKGEFGYPDQNVDLSDDKPMPIVKSVFPKQSITTLVRSLMDLISTRFIAPLVWRGHRTPYLLDWEKEVLDRSTVTIIKTSLLPPKLRHTLCTYLLRKTFLLAQKGFVDDGRRVPAVSFMVPEATDFFPKNIPEEDQETLPPLRETFYTIFRRGRRHQVVIDYDTAYWDSIDPKIINQTHYIFMYNNDRSIINEALNSFILINKENLQNSYDILKMKGAFLYLCRHNPLGSFLGDDMHPIVPACRVAQEGENFMEVWRSLKGKFKPVDPYYETVNKIHSEIKQRVTQEFRQLAERVEMAKKMPLSGSAEKFARYVYERSVAEQKNSFQQGDLVNDYFMMTADSPSKVSLYQFCDKLHKLGFIKLNKEKRPFTITINAKKLGAIFENKEAEQIESL